MGNEIKNTCIALFRGWDKNLLWIDGTIREDGNETRKLLQKKYIDEIKKYNFSYKMNSGSNDLRMKNVLQSVSNIG